MYHRTWHRESALGPWMTASLPNQPHLLVTRWRPGFRQIQINCSAKGPSAGDQTSNAMRLLSQSASWIYAAWGRVGVFYSFIITPWTSHSIIIYPWVITGLSNINTHLYALRITTYLPDCLSAGAINSTASRNSNPIPATTARHDGPASEYLCVHMSGDGPKFLLHQIL